ncbi:Pleckstrin homology domain-containing protein, partial [Dipodascopsis tothii]|uniref:Pleckstrin homology domain-containing protein n=1 Tax=Dipodascopsis tothii TaxID=44089 RepID=UPI0034CE3D42
MEALEVHSKAFLIKWINVPDNCCIRWQVRPNKRSINFGIFKRPAAAAPAPATPAPARGRNRSTSLSVLAPIGAATSSTSLASAADTTLGSGTFADTSADETGASAFTDEKTAHAGLVPVYWHGRCQANELLKGSYTVAAGNGGLFAFVFDNTFSKTYSKTVQFVQTLTYPDGRGARRPSVYDLPAPQEDPETSRERYEADVHDILRDQQHHPDDPLADVPAAVSLRRATTNTIDRFHAGMLLKKRRKKLQGYAKRYFALDYDLGTLSYYHDASSSLLRGSIPLTIVAISVRPQSREIFIDSGAEIWNLRAVNMDDFEAWKSALEAARYRTPVHPRALDVSAAGSGPTSASSPFGAFTPALDRSPLNVHPESSEWLRLQALGKKIDDAAEMAAKL